MFSFIVWLYRTVDEICNSCKIWYNFETLKWCLHFQKGSGVNSGVNSEIKKHTHTNKKYIDLLFNRQMWVKLNLMWTCSNWFSLVLTLFLKMKIAISTIFPTVGYEYLRTSEMDNNTHTILPWHNNTTYDSISSLTEVSQYIKQLLEILNYLFPGWYSIHLHSPLSH